MSEHREPDPALHDLAIQYALGTLDAAARRRFEARLASSAALRKLVGAYSELARELALLVPEEAPPRELWARIAAAIKSPVRDPIESVESAESEERAASGSVQPWKHWRAQGEGSADGFRFGASAEFHPTAIRGVEVRRLALDEPRDRVTLEIRMAPGSSYPAHRHGGVEECYVLEGDLAVGEVTMRAGDYQRVEAASVHPVQSTRGGCRLLIVSSLRDELLG